MRLITALFLCFLSLSAHAVWWPISKAPPQFVDSNGDPYSGAVLKFYEDGTTTPMDVATDSTGGTTVTSVALNAAGYPAVSGNVIIPHADQEYKIALYPSQAAADADSGAIWTVDNVIEIFDVNSVNGGSGASSSTFLRGDGTWGSLATTESICAALSDETTNISSGTAKVTFRMPYAFTISSVKSSLTGATTTGTFTIDINENLTTILSTKLTIDATEKTSTTAAVAAVISDASLASDAEITMDVDDAGDGNGNGAKVCIIGQRP